MTERRLTVEKPQKPHESGKEDENQLTAHQLNELLETEGARTLVEAAEERGFVEPTDLEAFALEHDLADDEVEQITRELEAIGLEIGEPRGEPRSRRLLLPRPSGLRIRRRSSARPTASSCSWPTSAATSCSPPPTRSSWRRRSSAATRSRSAG
jgi:hypothetical protein